MAASQASHRKKGRAVESPASRIEREERRDKVMEYSRAGVPVRQIGVLLGCSSTTVMRDREVRLKAYARECEHSPYFMAREIDKLERMQRAFWSQAVVEKDVRSGEFWLRLHERICLLMGREPPKPMVQTTTVTAEIANRDVRVNVQLAPSQSGAGSEGLGSMDETGIPPELSSVIEGTAEEIPPPGKLN